MIRTWRDLSIFFLVGVLCFCLSSCGGSVTRYNPGPPGAPTDLSVTAVSGGRVSLGWPAAFNAAGYNIYFSTSPGFTIGAGTKFGTTTSTTATVTGLADNTTYYFKITSANTSGESGPSNEVFATTPAVGAPFEQLDLVSSQGVAVSWYFNILVSGSGAGWMRGNLSVAEDGTVTINSFLDSNGGTTAPAGLFPVLLLSSDGQVADNADPALTVFKGVMATSRNMVVGTASPQTGSRLIAVLQRRVPGTTFSNAGDIAGFGNTSGGPRRFAYIQLSSGPLQEWEFAQGQAGQNRTVQYQAPGLFVAPSNPPRPGAQATTMAINADGIVTETRGTATPQPDVAIPAGVMSDDKSVIVATATGTSGKYVLRIYGMVNIVPSDANSLTLTDLTGTYRMKGLHVGVDPLWNTGLMSVDPIGAAVFSAFTDSNGGTASPSAIQLAIDTVVDTARPAMTGILTNAADATFHGKLSYFKDMVVFTRTEPSGLYSLSIGLK